MGLHASKFSALYRRCVRSVVRIGASIAFTSNPDFDSHSLAKAESRAPRFVLDGLPSTYRLRDATRETLEQMMHPAETSRRVDVFINDRFLGNERIQFGVRAIEIDPASVTHPVADQACFERHLLERSGVQARYIEQAFEPVAPDRGVPRTCVSIAAIAPAARATFHEGELRLDVSIPQLAMARAGHRTSLARRADAGITGLLANYTIDVFHSREAPRPQTTTTVDLAIGFNLRFWRWRQRSHIDLIDSANGSRRQFRTQRRYLMRPLPGWQAQLRMGEIEATSLAMASIPITGIGFGTDDTMLDDTSRGYAPVIRGIATSRSTLTVRQDGHALYETIVPAGPFEIDDLRPIAHAGPLEVLIVDDQRQRREASMRVSPLPRMVREHVLRYNASAGITRTHDLHAGLLDFSSQYGLNNVSTAQGAMQWTRHFNAQSLGIAISTRVGALAIDIDHAAAHTGTQTESKTQAQTAAEAETSTERKAETRIETRAETQDGIRRHAFGARLHYAQAWPGVHASFTLSATAHVGRIPLEWNAWAARFSHAPIDRSRSTNDPLLRRDDTRTAPPFAREATLTARWTQSWRSRIAWYLAGSASQTKPTSCATCHSSQFHVDIGASTTVAGVAVSAHLSYTRIPGNAPATTRVLIDLRSRIGNHPAPVQLAWRTEFDHDGRVSRRMSLNGEALTSTLSDRFGLPPLEYSLAFACRHAAVPGMELRPALVTHALFDSIGACAAHPWLDLSHHDAWGATQLAIQDHRSLSMIRSGSLLVHRHGITLGPSTGETLALIDTHGVAGLSVSGAHASTNRSGYALMPWLQPYRVNTLEIDRALMPREAALDAATVDVVPVAGAIVHVRFDARRELTRKLRVVLTDGRPAPFGASVRDAHGNVVATITQAGRLNVPVDAPAPMRIVHEASGTDCALAWPTQESNESIESTTSVRGVDPHPPGLQPHRVIAHCR